MAPGLELNRFGSDRLRASLPACSCCCSCSFPWELLQMRAYFDHERLKVYQSAITFVTWSTDLLASVQGEAVVRDHLDRASMRTPLNIAEGNGKFAIRDR